MAMSFGTRADTRILRLLGLLPLNGESWNGGRSCLPAVQMALEDVNAQSNILQDYNLTFKYVDTECTSGMAIFRMFESLNVDPPYVMVLGGMCSVASEATAEVTYLWNLTQFSCGSSSPVLSDRKRFPRFFRITLPDQKHKTARIDLMRAFDWKKVATINQALEFFSAVIDDFVREVQNTEITVISQEIFENDPLTRVKNLKAYKVGLYGPKIVWIFFGWYSQTFWRNNLQGFDCGEEEMSAVVDGSFITEEAYKNPKEERGIANMTASEFEHRFYNYHAYDRKYESYNFVAHTCYDTIWVVALALDCTVREMDQRGYAKTLDMFTYADADVNDIIFDCMSNTSMTGVSGSVAFTDSDPDKIIEIERIQDGKREPVGLYRQDKDPSYFEWIEDAIRWKDGIIPRDSTYVRYEEIGIPPTLFITMTSLAGLGSALALSFLTFNIIYRNNRYVKMSSPNINNVLLLGCILSYCTVFFKVTETSSGTLCKVRVILFSLGFTMTFGALFSKTWRVYRIFTNKKLLKRTIKDYQLLAIIGAVVAVVLVVLIVWETIGPHMVETKYLPKDIYLIGNDAEVYPYVRVCLSEYSEYFAWILYIIEGMLLTFGAFLAWETRHVQAVRTNKVSSDDQAMSTRITTVGGNQTSELDANKPRSISQNIESN
ncbi:gamma-aminobutyric acid type B receptor subunit 2-like [Mercenaria mercenaria]|uniref:gamma-aminobutyric acid type B receptor subunit 2-like n=1 Tax=Mercenaria mercenaria TaxID=6596 RepID=UPI00234F5022|nr:gamma-aminobutyric acid type B receptor subunit 2-like [Mercenaria mercenaria]